MRSVGRPKKRWLWVAVAALGGTRFTSRSMECAEDAINGRPRGAHEMRRTFAEIGIQRGSHIVHDGRRTTFATPRRELGMTNTAAYRARGEIVLDDPTSPSRGDLLLYNQPSRGEVGNPKSLGAGNLRRRTSHRRRIGRVHHGVPVEKSACRAVRPALDRHGIEERRAIQEAWREADRAEAEAVRRGGP